MRNIFGLALMLQEIAPQLLTIARCHIQFVPLYHCLERQCGVGARMMQ